jgi:hypothetical protein
MCSRSSRGRILLLLRSPIPAPAHPLLPGLLTSEGCKLIQLPPAHTPRVAGKQAALGVHGQSCVPQATCYTFGLCLCVLLPPDPHLENFPTDCLASSCGRPRCLGLLSLVSQASPSPSSVPLLVRTAVVALAADPPHLALGSLPSAVTSLSY